MSTVSCNHGRARKLFTIDYERFSSECQPVAYSCPSYADFQAGRCGICDDDANDNLRAVASEERTQRRTASSSTHKPPCDCREKRSEALRRVGDDNSNHDSMTTTMATTTTASTMNESNAREDGVENQTGNEFDENVWRKSKCRLMGFWDEYYQSGAHRPTRRGDGDDDGQRFYLNTDSEKPYCRKYTYVVNEQTHMQTQHRHAMKNHHSFRLLKVILSFEMRVLFSLLTFAFMTMTIKIN